MLDPNQASKLAEDINKTISLEGGPEVIPEPAGSAGDSVVMTTLKGRYTISAKLGEGGMGAVYAGFDNQLQQKVAIKLLKKAMSRNERAIEQLKSEAQVAMRLTHPLIMRLINFERDGEMAFLLMEMVNGRTLESIVKAQKDGRLASKPAAQVAYKVCEALEYAHQNGVIHRDIKPANIMIETGKNTVKLMDFGIARVICGPSGQRPVIAGTLPYIAPEIFEGSPPEPRADLYALGLTLYEILAGANPMRGKSTEEVIQNHATLTPPAIDGVDRGLMNIVLQCVEKKPNARFQSASEMKAALAKYLDLGEARVSREKKVVESEKKRIEGEFARLKREQEKLRAMEENRDQDTISSRPVYVHTSTKSPAFITPREIKTIAAVVGAGALGALLDSSMKTGEMGLFATASAYETSSAIFVPMLVVSLPAYFLLGGRAAVTGIVAGLVFGLASFRMGTYYIDTSLENEGWAPFKLVAYLTLSAPVALGIALSVMTHSSWRGSLAAGGLIALTAVGGLALVEGGFAEGLFGLTEENLGMFEIPFLSVAGWGAAAFSINKWQ
ncbi:MAG: protein kinase [Nitrospinae bacterium]|nr:protein kinase [Nitrospinota bacterium]